MVKTRSLNKETTGSGQSSSSSGRKPFLRSAGKVVESHIEKPSKKIKTHKTTGRTDSKPKIVRQFELLRVVKLEEASEESEEETDATLDETAEIADEIETNDKIKYAKESSNCYPFLSNSFFMGHTAVERAELPFTNVKTLIDALVEHKDDLELITIKKKDQQTTSTGIKIAPLECSECSDKPKLKNTRHLLTHLIEVHFPEHEELLKSCGLVAPEVQKKLDSVVKKQQETSFFQKTFEGNKHFVLRCTLANPVLRYLFEAPIEIRIKTCDMAVASVKFYMKDEFGKEHAVFIIFDGLLAVQRNVMKNGFLWRMKDYQDNTKNLEEEIGTWSRTWKQYFATQLALPAPYDDNTLAEEIKCQNIECLVKEIKKPNGVIVEIHIPINITGWNKKNINGMPFEMEVDD